MADAPDSKCDFLGKSVPAVGMRRKGGKVMISARELAPLAVLYFIKMEGRIPTQKTDGTQISRLEVNQ
jgi:hypothetical protein